MREVVGTWLDDCTIRLSTQEEAGVRDVTVTWPQPPTPEQVNLAYQQAAEREFPNSSLPGQGTTAVRRVLPWGLGTVYLHHSWGPPRWNFPRPLLVLKRRRVEVGIGWIYHAFSVAWIRED